MRTLKGILITSIALTVLSVGTAAQTKKVTELPADTTPTSDDLTMTVNDPAGTPANRKVTLANIFFVMSPWHFCADAGANDTYSCTLGPAPGSYVTGVHYVFKANTANTGAATINFNGLGAKTIKKVVGGVTTDLDDNDIRAGQIITLVYDGTNMQMQSMLGNAAASGAPTTATYITQTADGTLSNEQAMSALATGIVKSTTTTGVQSIATVDDVSSPVFCSDAGANDTYSCSVSPTISSYVTGTHYRFKANTANTGAATINLNTVGAKTIVKVAGGITTALADNDIRVGQWVDLVYDGTNMQMQSTSGNAASTTPGGSNQQVQFNNSSAFGGSSSFLFTGTQVRVPPGDATAPGLAFNGLTMGFYQASGPLIGFAYSGVAKMIFTDDLALGSGGGFKWSSTSAAGGTNDVGLLREAAGRVMVNDGGVFASYRDLRLRALIGENVSPSQITSDQNNYNPGRQRNQRWSSDASRTITGLSVTQLDGEEHLIVNVGSNSIVLSHQNASSTSTNRFLNSTGADITLAANEAADILYDNTTGRWRVFKRP